MVAATAWLDLVGSTAVYWGLHTMIKTRMPRELVRALRDSQSKMFGVDLGVCCGYRNSLFHQYHQECNGSK
jgi:hypothetical protein